MSENNEGFSDTDIKDAPVSPVSKDDTGEAEALEKKPGESEKEANDKWQKHCEDAWARGYRYGNGHF